MNAPPSKGLITWVGAVLLLATAGVAAAAEEGEGAGSTESPAPSPAPEVPSPPSPAPAPSPAPEASAPTAAVPPAPPPPAPAVEPEPELRSDASRAWDRRTRSRARWERRIEHRSRLPVTFAMQLSGGQEQVSDAGLRRHGAPASTGSFQFGLDVFPHPQIAVSLLVGAPASFSVDLVTADPEDYVIDGELYDPYYGSAAYSEIRVETFALSGKAILAPSWFVLRPFARVGAGAHRVTVSFLGDTAFDDRTRSRPAGFAALGGGLELTTPRKRDGLVIPWGIGAFIEGGARLGGGGETPGSPAARFGDWGSVDVGPGYLRAGWVFLF